MSIRQDFEKYGRTIQMRFPFELVDRIELVQGGGGFKSFNAAAIQIVMDGLPITEARIANEAGVQIGDESRNKHKQEV